jgi:hypothetical protein
MRKTLILHQQTFLAVPSVRREKKEPNSFFYPFSFFVHFFLPLPTLQPLRLTSAKHGNRKMAKSFLSSVLFYFYSRRLSKKKYVESVGVVKIEEGRRDGSDYKEHKEGQVVSQMLVFKVGRAMDKFYYPVL